MTVDDSDSTKSKFREALDKKKTSRNPQVGGKSGNSKVHGGQSGNGSPKLFRRKSGSS